MKLANALKHITPLKPNNKVFHERKKPKIKINAPFYDESEFEFGFDFAAEDVSGDAEVFYANAGLDEKTIRKLKKGFIPIESVLDLHGYNRENGTKVMVRFLENSLARKLRLVLIIHGKGNLNYSQPPIMKNLALNILHCHKKVLAFCSAKPKDGGAGATYVLLSRKNSE